MKRLILISLIALSLTSCVIHVGVVPDGNLKYYSEALLCEVCETNQLNVSTSTASIELEGSYDNIINILVGYYECRPGDAIIYLENGTIKAGSRSGKQVKISKVSGEIPGWLNLKISNSTGNVDVSYMQEAHQIRISNATGNISLEENDVEEMGIEVGSGNVYLTDNTAYEMRLRVGSGNIYLDDIGATNVDIQAGSGNVTLEDSDLDYGSISAGSGDIILIDSDAYNVDMKVGSGRIIHQD